MRTTKRTAIIVILVAIPFVALDVALFLAGKFRVEAVITFVAVFAVMVGFYWFRRIRGEKVENDERTLKLASRVGSHSWLISFLVVCFLSGVDTVGLLHLSGAQYLAIVMMVMSCSYLILTFFMNRKADIE